MSRHTATYRNPPLRAVSYRYTPLPTVTYCYTPLPTVTYCYTPEQEVDTLSSDSAALKAMLDALLQEHSSLLTFLAELDAETIAEAAKGWGTDDARLIKTISSRTKAHLGKVSKVYWEAHDMGLEKVIEKECGGWYGYLAKFIVLSEARVGGAQCRAVPHP